MRTQLVLVTLVSAVLSTAAFAQATSKSGGASQSSSSAQGVQIQGNTDIKASQENTAAVAVGEGNTAKNTAGAIKGGTQIQGNTKIKAKQKNTAAVAVGKGNTAANEAGQIGGK
ncbi:MAG: hypothetical protein WC073_07195 [Sterolibacterium sp.]